MAAFVNTLCTSESIVPLPDGFERGNILNAAKQMRLPRPDRAFYHECTLRGSRLPREAGDCRFSSATAHLARLGRVGHDTCRCLGDRSSVSCREQDAASRLADHLADATTSDATTGTPHAMDRGERIVSCSGAIMGTNDTTAWATTCATSSYGNLPR